MAQSLMAALRLAGHDLALATDFRTYDGTGSPDRQQALKVEGLDIADRLVAAYRSPSAWRPDLWFTYHVYHKTPDWLGPRIKRALDIPYLIAEASIAPKRANGAWQIGYRSAAEAIDEADGVLCLTRLDMDCLGRFMAHPERLHYLAPFIDTKPFEDAKFGRDQARARLSVGLKLDPKPPWLLAVGMMRPGDKLESYRRLGAALRQIEAEDWRLLIVGDGDAHDEVHAALAVLGDKLVYTGALAPDELVQVYAASDIAVWPAAGEAYGIALLEAQAAGLAVIAGRERGVPDVVLDGETGILTAPGEADAFAAATRRLIHDETLRHRLGKRAQEFVQETRALKGAARQLDSIIESLAQ